MKRKIVLMLFTLFLTRLFLISCSPEYPAISRIQFPEFAGVIPDNVEIQLQLDEAEQSLFGGELAVYKIVPRRTGENYDQEILDLFGFVPDETLTGDYYNTYKIGDFDEKLSIYKNGCFFYSIASSHYTRTPLTKTDDEILAEGEAYLRSKNLLPDHFYAGSELGGTIMEDSSGSYFATKSMGFFQRIGEYEILGRSEVFVEFWEEGIAGVGSVYSNYTFDRNIVCKSYKQVVEESKDYIKHGMFSYDTDIVNINLESVVFTDVEIVYYDSPMDKPALTHIQPCYRFRGTATDAEGNTGAAYWTISAIPEDYLV